MTEEFNNVVCTVHIRWESVQVCSMAVWEHTCIVSMQNKNVRTIQIHILAKMKQLY